MKKLLSALSLILLGFTLTACVEDDKKPDEDTNVEIPGGGSTDEDTGTETPDEDFVDTSEFVKYLNNLIEGTPLEASFDTYKDYDEAGVYGDAAASTYVMNNYVVPVVIENLSLGLSTAEITTDQIDEIFELVMAYVNIYIQIEELNALLESNSITWEDYYVQYDALIETAPTYVELLMVFEVEDLTLALLKSLNNLDENITVALDEIVEKEVTEVAAEIELIKTALLDDSVALVCNLTEKEMTNLVYVSKLTLGNTQDFVIDVEVAFADLMAKYFATATLTENDVKDVLSTISKSYNDTYGSITENDITKALEIVSALTKKMFEEVDLTSYAQMATATLNSMTALVNELCLEEHTTLIYDFAMFSIDFMMDPTTEPNEELTLGFMKLLAKLFNVSVDAQGTLDSATLDMLLGIQGDEVAVGMIEYLSYCANIIVSFDEIKSPTEEQKGDFEVALIDFMNIIVGLMM